ncbi:TIGR04197 family type VII secretion effector [Candidatus Enterococcus ikei]|uniref:TIGR04197 family type VII secretion effector n=1 Tax=Candidatus Enterococcus ikei TaxID=2815326 RepID=A0ABS3GUF1_9ENTE|nr:TIGR04197 family type VII secretion effector [Enterococcus sp. DIV0869a]MBO0438886.1 TIGR04197 family type VII secretion effector [Enterococcus sp. DIV0869a]
MSEVNSSLIAASDVSSRFNKVASGFSSINAATIKAERTTVHGNTNAKNSLARFHSRGQRLANVVARDGNYIHSVAKEFNLIDQKIEKNFNSQLVFPAIGGGVS